METWEIEPGCRQPATEEERESLRVALDAEYKELTGMDPTVTHDIFADPAVRQELRSKR